MPNLIDRQRCLIGWTDTDTNNTKDALVKVNFFEKQFDTLPVIGRESKKNEIKALEISFHWLSSFIS